MLSLHSQYCVSHLCHLCYHCILRLFSFCILNVCAEGFWITRLPLCPLRRLPRSPKTWIIDINFALLYTCIWRNLISSFSDGCISPPPPPFLFQRYSTIPLLPHFCLVVVFLVKGWTRISHFKDLPPLPWNPAAQYSAQASAWQQLPLELQSSIQVLFAEHFIPKICHKFYSAKMLSKTKDLFSWTTIINSSLCFSVIKRLSYKGHPKFSPNNDENKLI